MGKGLICPGACGPEAAWAAADMTVLAPPHLLSLVNHFKGLQTLRGPKPTSSRRSAACPTSRTSKARRAPSACSRSPPPADTTC